MVIDLLRVAIRVLVSMVRYLALELFYGELRRRDFGVSTRRIYCLVYQMLGVKCALHMSR